MRAYVTGGTGFIGGRVAQKLRDRGDEVVALVRSEANATALKGMGCEIVIGDVTQAFSIERSLRDVEAVFHIAGWFEIGIRKFDCPRMQDVNIGGVRHVIDAAIEAEVPRIVYASSMTVYGDTGGKKATESYVRDPLQGFLSCYDESKYRAQLLAEDRARNGAPIVIVQPCAVFGPGDTSEVGRQLLGAAAGKLPAIMLAHVGMTYAHVDDIADGFLAAHDRGQMGESYILGGDSMTLHDAMRRAAQLTGRKLTSRSISPSVLKLLVPAAPYVAPALGYPPNLREVIRATDGVTYFGDDTKARTELGYDPRSFDEGLRDYIRAQGLRLAE